MAIIEFLQGFFGERFLGFFLTITHLGGEAIYVVLLSLYYWLVDPRQGRKLSLIFMLSIISNILIKMAIDAPRPYVLNPAVATIESLKTHGDMSFPSGHAQGITTFWGAIAVLHNKLWIWILAITLIILVSLSRLYLGVHFPVDVAAGMLLGIVWIVLGLWASRYETLLQYKLWQKICIWVVGGLLAIAFPLLKELIGIFCGFLPLPQTQFSSPPKVLDKIILGTIGLTLVIISYLAMKQLSLFLPEFPLLDYARHLAIALIVTEGVPWAWQHWQQVKWSSGENP